MAPLDIIHPEIRIDYRSHPAFSGLSESLLNDNEEEFLERIVSEIDEVYALATSSTSALSQNFLTRLQNSFINPLFSELESLLQKGVPNSCIYKGSISEIVNQTLTTIEKQIQFRNGSKLSEKVVVDAPLTRSTAEDLRLVGASIRKLPEEYIQALWTLTEPYRAASLQMRRTNPYKVCSNPLPLSGQYWEITSQILKGVGFMDALNLHYGYQMVPMYCTLVHSYPGESWYRDPYQDVGLRTSQCTYMHYDHADEVPKALIYTSEVKEENGPFSIVPYSNNWHKSHTRGVLVKYVDQIASALARSQSDERVTYHRPQFSTRALRSEFMSLPRILQGSSHFGDDIIDGSELSKFLLARELRITSDIGNCTLFSGSSTIHRGGMVTRGERWVFQLAFKQAE
jgi:hypothetical protein